MIGLFLQKKRTSVGTGRPICLVVHLSLFMFIVALYGTARFRHRQWGLLVCPSVCHKSASCEDKWSS